MVKQVKQLDEPHLHKVFTGKVKQVGIKDAEEPMDRLWESAIFKEEKKGEIQVSASGLAGDDRDDTTNDGSLDHVLFCYPIKHYTYWQNKYEREDITIGGMGENFAVLEMDEFSVCIGDLYQVGRATIQVSAPSLPTWRQARRFQEMNLAYDMQQTGRTGWHCRVIKEGQVWEDCPIELIERPHPHWSVQAANEIMHLNKADLRAADDLADCIDLSARWRKLLKNRLYGKEPSVIKRIYGPNRG
jgi:MOSC domain-containing protein YiiM